MVLSGMKLDDQVTDIQGARQLKCNINLQAAVCGATAGTSSFLHFDHRSKFHNGIVRKHQEIRC